jgi:PAS domain S-box-containing protein
MDFYSLLSPGSYAFNPLSVPNFLITGVLVQLGLSTLLEPTARMERGQRMVNRLWFAVCLAAIIWQFCFGMLYMSRNDSVALFWDRMAYVGIISIPLTFMLFSIRYLDVRPMMCWWWSLAGIGGGFILLLPSGLLVRGIRHYGWGPYTLVGTWHHPFLLYFAFTMGLSFYLFFRRLFSEQHPVRRRQIKQVLIAFLAADLGAVDYLPAYGVNLLPVGNFSLIVFMSLATWFIARHRALQLSPAVAANQILTAMTNLLIVFQQDRRIAFANQALLGTIGISHRNLIGQPLEALLRPPVLTEEETWATLNKRGNIIREDISLVTATGESIPVRFAFSAVKEEKGEILGYIGLGWDRRPELERLELKEALLESQKKAYADLQVLNQAKQRMLDHLAHEMKTPLAIITGSITLLGKLYFQNETHFHSIQERLERSLKRLNELGDEVGDIVLRRHFLTKPFLERMIRECQDLLETLIEEQVSAPSLVGHLKNRFEEIYFQGDYTEKEISLHIWIPETLETIRPLHQHRQVRIELDIQPTPPIRIPEVPLGKTLIGLVRNAIENTPDGSRILIKLHEGNGVIYLEVIDFGVGIDTEFQKQIFHGFVHPIETTEYSSGAPYGFMAGGKGGDLLRIKLFSERLGFRIEFVSRRCPYVQKHGECPGNVETCSFYLNGEESCKIGGSLFKLEFPSNLFAYQASS